jgi:hypothetical protein
MGLQRQLLGALPVIATPNPGTRVVTYEDLYRDVLSKRQGGA